ncbi:5'-3' exonuclease [Mycoplasma sp. 1890]
MKQKILIIDGTYLTYRSYFAINKNNTYLTNAEGVSTSTILLFFRTLFNLIEEYSPSHLFIAFDAVGKTFRHNLYEHYKEGRAKMPNEFYNQMTIIRKLLTSLNIVNIEKAGVEADDLIAKVCFEYPLIEKIIFSADQDLNQLINEYTSIIKKTKEGIVILTPKNFKSIYGINPNQVVDYKAIVGDSSDNFFGVKGVGSKSAIKLLDQYQTLDNIYENLENLSSSRLAQKFIDYKSIAFRDQHIAKLVTNFELEGIKLNLLDIANVELTLDAANIIDEFQLNSIRRAFFKKIKIIN